MNPMKESIELFGEICSLRMLNKTSIILLLTKHDSFMNSLTNKTLDVCFNTKHGWNHEQWKSPNYSMFDIDFGKININDEETKINSNEFDDDDDDEQKTIPTNDDDNNHDETDLLKYFPKQSHIVQDALNDLEIKCGKLDRWFIKCYKYSLSFIIKQYIQMSKYYQPSLMDKNTTHYRRDRQIHVHVIDARNSNDVKSMLDCEYYEIEWKYERLIWIAYFKNDENEQCLLKYVPKVLLLIIIRYLKTEFSIWKCIQRDLLQTYGETL